MRRLALAVLTVTAFVLLAAPSARANPIPVTVQDLTFLATVPTDTWAKDNKLNNSLTWFDDDSGTLTSSIISDNDNSNTISANDTSVGLALNVYSARTGHAQGEYAYFGGIFKFQEINDDSSNIPSNRELTGKFYNLQVSNILDATGAVFTPGSTVGGVTFLGMDGNGNANLVWSGAQTKYTFGVEFAEGAEFELWVDADAASGGTAFPSGTQPSTSPDINTNVDFKTGVETGNANWAAATDSSVYPTTPLLKATVTDKVMATITVDTSVSTLGYIKYVSTTELDEGTWSKDGAAVATGGALAPLVNPFGNPTTIGGTDSRDGYMLVSNFKFVGISDGMQELSEGVLKPANWVGDIGAGGNYAVPVTQSSGIAEYKDDIEIHANLQTPDPATVAFVAPVLFGFLGYSVRRRRQKR